MQDSLEFTGYFLSKILLPLVTLVATGVAFGVAYQRGMFSRRSLPEPPDRQQVRIGQVHGDIHLIPSNVRGIAIDASKVDEYHQQSINQSKISFWFSLVFASLGFLIIATSVFAYSEKSGYLGVVAGGIIDAVAALFFHQSNRARRSMAEFFDRLRVDRKIEEALHLCDGVDDPARRNALRTKLSLHFAEIDGGDEALSRILNHGVTAFETPATMQVASGGNVSQPKGTEEAGAEARSAPAPQAEKVKQASAGSA